MSKKKKPEGAAGAPRLGVAIRIDNSACLEKQAELIVRLPQDKGGEDGSPLRKPDPQRPGQ